MVTELSEAELKRQVLAQYTLDTDVIGQMQANVERMEREGTISQPALDSKSPENAGKTQHQVDKEIKASYAKDRDMLVKKYKKLFEVGAE